MDGTAGVDVELEGLDCCKNVRRVFDFQLGSCLLFDFNTTQVSLLTSISKVGAKYDS